MESEPYNVANHDLWGPTSAPAPTTAGLPLEPHARRTLTCRKSTMPMYRTTSSGSGSGSAGDVALGGGGPLTCLRQIPSEVCGGLMALAKGT